MLVSNNSGGGRPYMIGISIIEAWKCSADKALGREEGQQIRITNCYRMPNKGLWPIIMRSCHFCSRLFPHELTWGIWFSRFGNNERKKEGAKTGKLRSESSHLKKRLRVKKNHL